MPTDTPSFFLSADKIEALAAWKSSEPNVASVYLPVDESGSYPSTLDRLIRDGGIPPGVKRDVERIAAFVRGRVVPGSRRGLCVFSCVKYGIFEAFAAPETVTASLTVASRPHLRPLNDLRRLYYRFVALQSDARSARFTEIHLGESFPLNVVDGDFTGKGVESLAESANTLCRARRADRLVVGGDPDLLAALEPLLSPDLRNGLIHESLLGLDRPVEAVVARVRHNELQAQEVREQVVVSHFLSELRANGAVAGLERVAEALQQGCVKRLLVREGWAKMGRCCTACGRLSVDHRSCPWCFRATEPLLDLVEELTDRAAAAGVEVFRVARDARFDGAGRIGAELTVPRTPSPTAPARKERTWRANVRPHTPR